MSSSRKVIELRSPVLLVKMSLKAHLHDRENWVRTRQNIGTLSVQELFFQLIGWLGVELGVSPVRMVYFMG